MIYERSLIEDFISRQVMELPRALPEDKEHPVYQVYPVD